MNKKEILKNFYNLRKGWEPNNACAPHPMELSIAWQLLKTGAAGAVDDVDTFELLYDDLCINSEIITKINFEEYDTQKLASRGGISTQSLKNKIFKFNKIILLNFERFHHAKNGAIYGDRVDCFICYNADYIAPEVAAIMEAKNE